MECLEERVVVLECGFFFVVVMPRRVLLFRLHFIVVDFLHLQYLRLHWDVPFVHHLLF